MLSIFDPFRGSLGQFLAVLIRASAAGRRVFFAGFALTILTACSQLPHPVSLDEAYSDADIAFDFPDNFEVLRNDNQAGPLYRFNVKRLAFMDNQLSAAKRKSTRCYLRIEDFPGANFDHQGTLVRFLKAQVAKTFEGQVLLDAPEIPPELEGRILARAQGSFDVTVRETVYRSGVAQRTTTKKEEFWTFGQVIALSDGAETGRFGILECYYSERFQNLIDALAERLTTSAVLKN